VIRGNQPRFVGFGLQVGSREDLEKLAALPGASAVESVSHPGGGECVTLVDPSGFKIEAIFGQTESEGWPIREPLTWNVGAKMIRMDSSQRVPMAPAEIIRLGHVVLEVADFQTTCAWYTQHFGFIPSDVQVLEDGTPAVVFMRLDLGDKPTDHHTLALAQGFMPTYSHSAYEVVDVDSVGMGQRYLKKKGWKHAWGMGRHILGSQIFDYWKDPWGDKHEHYCDGDVFTSLVPTGVHAISRQAMSQWGPIMPSSFTRPQLSFKNLTALVHNLLKYPGLIKKLAQLAKHFG
jgi:catechol 2,3-dioxygenase-like lactoylglutathione lyase family enzyme